MTAFSAVGPSSAGASATGATSLSFSHPGGASDTAVYLGVGVGNNADSGITASATFGGTSMTATPAKVETGSGGAGFLQGFKMESPPGGTQTVAISVSSTSDITAGSVSVTGSSGTGTPWSNANTGGVDQTPTATSPSAIPSGDLVIAFAAAGQPFNTTTSPSTSRFVVNLNTGSGAGNSAGATSPGTGSTVTTAWSLFNTDFWAVIAFDAQSAGAASAPPFIPQQHGGAYWRRKHRRAQQLIPPSAVIVNATLSLTGAGQLTDASGSLGPVATQSAPSVFPLSGALTGLAVQGSGTALGGGATMAPTATQSAPVSLASAGSWAGKVVTQAVLSLGPSSSLGAMATQLATSAFVAASSLAGKATQLAKAVLSALASVVLDASVGLAIRPPAALGGIVTAVAYSGSVTNIDPALDGSATVSAYSGTTALMALSGTFTDVTPTFAGTFSQVAFGGITSQLSYGGTSLGWSMQVQDITLMEHNDETLDVVIKKNGTNLNITGYTIEAYLKTSATTADTDGTTIKLSTATGEITITDAPNGAAEVAIPATDLADVTHTFWRLDVLLSGKRNTVFSGKVTVTPL